MAIGDELLSLPSNLLALHWLCDFRNNRRVRHRHLPYMSSPLRLVTVLMACLASRPQLIGNDSPDIDGLADWRTRSGPRSHEARGPRYYDFQCARIMNSSGNKIVTGTPKCKSLLF